MIQTSRSYKVKTAWLLQSLLHWYEINDLFLENKKSGCNNKQFNEVLQSLNFLHVLTMLAIVRRRKVGFTLEVYMLKAPFLYITVFYLHYIYRVEQLK